MRPAGLETKAEVRDLTPSANAAGLLVVAAVGGINVGVTEETSTRSRIWLFILLLARLSIPRTRVAKFVSGMRGASSTRYEGSMGDSSSARVVPCCKNGPVSRAAREESAHCTFVQLGSA